MTDSKNCPLSGLALIGFAGLAYFIYRGIQKNKHPKVIEEG